jgi:hypothetical protein
MMPEESFMVFCCDMLYSSVVGDIPFFFLKSGLNSNRKVQKK